MARPDKVRKSLLSRCFDRAFWMFLVLATAAAAACWVVQGPEVFKAALHDDLGLMAVVFPRVLLALLVAGLVQVILPRDKVAYWVGSESGLRGILIATVAGALTPGGPMTSFPFVVALYMAGADRGSLVAYLTSWSLLGFQRFMVWEGPSLGIDFALLRALANLPLPIIAGLLARKLPGMAARVPPPGEGDLAADIRAVEAHKAQERAEDEAAATAHARGEPQAEDLHRG
jgi:uncharacterized membrane protein YraQ (UPF0718 family)